VSIKHLVPGTWQVEQAKDTRLLQLYCGQTELAILASLLESEGIQHRIHEPYYYEDLRPPILLFIEGSELDRTLKVVHEFLGRDRVRI